MRFKSAAIILTLLALAPLAHSQAWKDSYDRALASAKAGEWSAAKAAFLASAAIRPEDQSAATVLPGPVTEPVRWRDGAPYSPNFCAAYCSYKIAQGLKDDEKKAVLHDAATVFETLIAKNQVSIPTLYFLNLVYGGLGQPDKQRELEPRIADPSSASWRVDTELVSPEELASLKAAMPTTAGGTKSTGSSGLGPNVTIIKPGQEVPKVTTSIAGRVPIVNTKFAFIIGNSQTQMSNGAVPYSASDAMVVQEALVQNAGYDDKNVDVVTDVTSDTMLKTAQALADRIPQDATVVIYFSGIGVNIDGRDYFAGIDAAMTTDTSKMLAKEDLFKVFRAKGAKIFLFCQANRPIKNGRYFGMETPLVGRMSLCQATSPGSEVFGTVSGGKMIGLYTKAFVDVLAAYRSNQVPITDFFWALFQALKGGSEEGGSTLQVPSIPQIRYMGDNASF